MYEGFYCQLSTGATEFDVHRQKRTDVVFIGCVVFSRCYLYLHTADVIWSASGSTSVGKDPALFDLVDFISQT